MSTTTTLTVVCPACGQEVELRCQQVEVTVDESIRVVQVGLDTPTRLKAEATATGPHACRRV